MDIFKLRGYHQFKNDKIEISYSTGDISSALSVYLIDSEGMSHHVYWNIHPDRCHQSFDKTNDKVKDFIFSKVSEWIKEQDSRDELRRAYEEKEKNNKKELVSSLMNNF